MKRSCGCFAHDGFQLCPEDTHSEQIDLFGVDAMAPLRYLDSRVSVSGLKPMEIIFDDAVVDSQYRRFLNGS